MTKLTTGEKNRRANLRSLKATGRRNAKLRAAATVRSFLAHVERNNAAAEQAAQARAEAHAEHLARNEDRRIMAIIAKRDRIAAGIAKRDAHNAALRDAASLKADAYELAYNRPAAMGDGYGAAVNDNGIAKAA